MEYQGFSCEDEAHLKELGHRMFSAEAHDHLNVRLIVGTAWALCVCTTLMGVATLFAPRWVGWCAGPSVGIGVFLMLQLLVYGSEHAALNSLDAELRLYQCAKKHDMSPARIKKGEHLAAIPHAQ